MSQPTKITTGENTSPARFVLPPWAIFVGLIAVLVGGWLYTLEPQDPFDLPRPGHSVTLLATQVGDWHEGATGYVGLKVGVTGEGLSEKQTLRFTEGSERVHAKVKVRWLDANGKTLGEDFEKPFKDDC